MRVATLWLVLVFGGAWLAIARAEAWWESAVVYQIYPRSFMDSNRDGIGDLNGITEKLQYFKDTGVDAIWLSPIFKSPMYDFGYDIADYRAIADEYGTMEDFDNLMAEAKKLGVRVILDYVPNHTSNESDWFVKSAQRDPEYVDYYIWADGKTDPDYPDQMAPPNNWYFKDTGVDAIWLSPIFKSPMYDFGYDIADYRAIADEYGTMEDFDNLMAEAKKLGVRVILDYVPNHTSNESDWFVKSAQRDPEYVDYYIWADGKTDPDYPDQMAPPNNWISIFRKSAWEYNPVRQQYYLHQFVIGQPDLNYRNPKVLEEMKEVLRFWLDKGVSGFRVDAVNMIFEVDPAKFDGKYPDEPLSGAADATPDDYDYLVHIYTSNQLETYNTIYDWRAVLDEYEDKEPKVMMTEAYTDLKGIMRYYGNEDRDGSIPFNFIYLEGLKKDSNARDMKMVVDKWMTYMPSGKTANWVNGNHDQSRLASRHGDNRVDALNMLALLLPGVTITYQGEELGMTDGEVSWEETKDPQACNTDDPINYWKKSRDPCRTPFHWDSSPNAGFSTGSSTWLPIADNYNTLNLEAQMGASKSHYKFYKDMVAVKHLPAVRTGDLQTAALSDAVLVVLRLLPGQQAVVGVINLSDEAQSVDLSASRLLPDELQVVAAGFTCSIDNGAHVLKNSISVSGHCALALKSTNNCC